MAIASGVADSGNSGNLELGCPVLKGAVALASASMPGWDTNTGWSGSWRSLILFYQFEPGNDGKHPPHVEEGWTITQLVIGERGYPQ